MAIDKFKDVTIKDREYRLGRVTAEIGSWTVTQMSAGKAGDFEVYQKIKGYLFEKISVYQDPGDGSRSPMRIYEGGRWLAPELDLEYDLDLFESLFSASVEYNFHAFFEKRKAEAKTLNASTIPAISQ